MRCPKPGLITRPASESPARRDAALGAPGLSLQGRSYQATIQTLSLLSALLIKRIDIIIRLELSSYQTAWLLSLYAIRWVVAAENKIKVKRVWGNLGVRVWE